MVVSLFAWFEIIEHNTKHDELIFFQFYKGLCMFELG